MNKLYVDILRGANKIGENLIEISDGETVLLLECGVPICSTSLTESVEERVLRTHYDGVLITHCHRDHSGLLKEQIDTDRIYMGEATYRILEYCDSIHEGNKDKIVFLKSETPFFIGGIKVVPHLCDHSAYDSYMLEIEKKGESVLYTGDFRSNGRKNFEGLLRRLPQKVDCLITERTNISARNKTESDLEMETVKLMKQYDKVFLLQSTLNIDRTVSFYRAATRVGIPFIMSLSSADINSDFSNIPTPISFSNCYTYLNRSYNKEDYDRVKSIYGNKLLGRVEIAKKSRYAMQIHSGLLGYLQKMSFEGSLQNSVLIYSMWQGYKAEMQAFLDGIKALGIQLVDLHVSGHADLQAIKRLIAKTQPKEIYMVHCEK